MSEERWLPVVGYEGLYEVSDMGNVRSLDRLDVLGRIRKGRQLRTNRNSGGHLLVRLCDGGDEEDMQVHRIVLMAFVGPCQPGMVGCHWNDDPEDNRLENLRWATRSDNTRDSVRNGTHNMARRGACSKGHPYDAQNTYVRADGSRACRTCHREWQREHPDVGRRANRKYREKRKAA